MQYLRMFCFASTVFFSFDFDKMQEGKSKNEEKNLRSAGFLIVLHFDVTVKEDKTNNTLH